MKHSAVFYFIIIIVILNKYGFGIRTYTKEDLIKFREEVKEMFYHAYNSYLNSAHPYDELRPLSCDGIDTYGSYSLTLIDALDTLAIMGNFSEFQRVANILAEIESFDFNMNVSVFETNIRVIGGLLSAHLLYHRAGIELEPGWPCNGPLLRLAEDIAKRLIVAFNTPTGMPYGTVNLKTGVPKGETTVTCTAGIGTFIIEFGTLSRLTGDPIYEEIALNAINSLFKHRSQIGLFGNHIDVATGRWTAQDAGIGSGVDSFFEYLVKGSLLLQKPELLQLFKTARKSIEKYMKRDDWYMWVSMTKGQVTIPVFQSLEAYWPGLLSLLGETENAMKTLHNFHQVWSQYGFIPEFYNIPQLEVGNNRENYPLRPELIESVMYLHRATNDPYLLQVGVDMLKSLQHSARTPCGYATIKDVRDHVKEDRMESFFLAETTKYLYLLFDTDNFIHNQGGHGKLVKGPNGGNCVLEAGGYIFNTEAHPIDPSALHCCYQKPKVKIDNLRSFVSNRAAKKEFYSVGSEAKKREHDSLFEKFDENLGFVEVESAKGREKEVKSTTDSMSNIQNFLLKIRKQCPKKESDRVSESDYTLLSCTAQIFKQKISIFGEFLVVELDEPEGSGKVELMSLLRYSERKSCLVDQLPTLAMVDHELDLMIRVLCRLNSERN